MLKRVISGTVFTAVVVGFFLLRQFVDYRIFHILTWFFTAFATYEVARAVAPFSVKGSRIVACVSGAILLPLYALFEYLIAGVSGWLIAIDLMLVSALIIVIIALIKGADFKTGLVSVLPVFYPSLLMLSMAVINDLGYTEGFIALLLVFVISPCSDVMAFFVGSALKGPKLCPKLSPKKTWSGAIGGTLGGMLGALLVWLVFRFDFGTNLAWLIYLAIGLVGSVCTIIGDLIESLIKRKTGIKDMGNIMPGHGGIMDRIDGISLASVLIMTIFLIV